MTNYLCFSINFCSILCLHGCFNNNWKKWIEIYIIPTKSLPVCTLSPICSSDIGTSFPFFSLILAADGKQCGGGVVGGGDRRGGGVGGGGGATK